MVPEYWLLGEAVQDHIVEAGYESEAVDGIAVDIHDLLQAADHIKSELAPAVLAAKDKDAILHAIQRLLAEFEHVRWHGANAQSYLSDAAKSLS